MTPARFAPPPRRSAEAIALRCKDAATDYSEYLALRAPDQRDPERLGLLQGGYDTLRLAMEGVPPSARLFHDIRKEASPTPYQRGVMHALTWLGVGRPFRSEQEIDALRYAALGTGLEAKDKQRALTLKTWATALDWVLGEGRPVDTSSDDQLKAREGYDPDELPPLAGNEPG